MTTDPTPQHDHGAAGFCTDHALPDGRTETVARVLWDTRCIEGGVNQRILREPTRRESLRIAAAVVAALGDETARLREERDEAIRWAESVGTERDAARAILARVRALAWDEALQAVAWALVNGPDPIGYTRDHNPYRAALDPEEPR